MLYLLDASVLVTAKDTYYRFDAVPEFWEWLSHIGAEGQTKLPLEIFEEVKDGTDALSEWVGQQRQALLLEEEVDVGLVHKVMENGYAPDLSDDEVEQVGRDPFLVAYALSAPNRRCVVTAEVSKPSRQRANRHIPDVCRSLEVEWCTPFEFYRRLNFHTGWNS